jgi:hypothetical protein
MRRLITSGCSFTKHCWNTWADYIGKDYDWHKQLGIGGSDNANIARRVISTVKKNDTVIIMWTGYDRWNFYNSEWEYDGCLVGNKNFYTNHYSPIERFTTTMDYMQMIDNHSKLIGYTCHHFNAFPWFLSEVQKTIPNDIIDVYESYDIDNNYVLSSSLMDFQEDNNDTTVSHKYDKNDTHPTPLIHWMYLNKVMKPLLGLPPNATNDIPNHIIKEQEDVLNGIVL